MSNVVPFRRPQPADPLGEAQTLALKFETAGKILNDLWARHYQPRPPASHFTEATTNVAPFSLPTGDKK